MGLLSSFKRVSLSTLRDGFFPAVARALESHSVTELAAWLDLDVIATMGGTLGVGDRRIGILRKRTVTTFSVPEDWIIDAFIKKAPGDAFEADKVLYYLRSSTKLLSNADWTAWDALLEGGRNLPPGLASSESYALILPVEISGATRLVRAMARGLGESADDADDRALLARLAAYLDAAPPNDAVIVYYG
jgi:hypothetical protein